jgi:hypothetical protein
MRKLIIGIGDEAPAEAVVLAVYAGAIRELQVSRELDVPGEEVVRQHFPGL